MAQVHLTLGHVSAAGGILSFFPVSSIRKQRFMKDLQFSLLKIYLENEFRG
jgi:hypothetical protein